MPNKFVLGVCGDSWMQPDFVIHKNTHFTQLLCEEFNWRHNCYARTGASVGHICLQIEQAIEDKVDLILFGTTPYNRIEYNANDMIDKTGYNWDKFPKITLRDMGGPSPILTDPEYPNYNDSNFQYSLISDNLTGLLSYGFTENFVYQIINYAKLDRDDAKIKHKAIEEWFKHIYNPAWKLMLDRWCLYAVLHKAYKAEIPCVCVIDFTGIEDLYWLDKPVLGEKWLKDFRVPPNSPGYHTSIEQQKEILQDVKNRLKTMGIIE